MRNNLRRIRAKSSVTRMLAGLALILCLTAMASAQTSTAKVKAGEIIIKAQPGMSADSLRQLTDKAGCDYVRAVPFCPGFHLVRLKKYANTSLQPKTPVDIDADTTAAIATLKQASGIAAADPNYFHKLFYQRKPLTPQQKDAAKSRATAPTAPNTITPNDQLYARQWGMVAIRMPEAWSIQSSANPVTVGMVDTGIDANHPDFIATDGKTNRIIGGQSFVPDGPNNTVVATDIVDRVGHGTHTTGTVGATTNNTIGVAGVAGYNAGGVDVRFRIARVFGTDGSTDDVVYGGFGYLIDNSVDVINYSGGSYGTSALASDTVSRGLQKGITIVASLGNDTLDTGRFPTYPANYPGVIAVSAVNFNRTLSSYSNFGGAVAIGAPGGDFDGNGQDVFDHQIWSTWPTYLPSDAGVVGYNAISGTSMAAPHVTGAVALLLAAGAPHNPATIKQALQDTALPLSDDTPNPGGGNKYGAGLLDAYSALLLYADPPFRAGLAGPLDLGTTYSSLLQPFVIRVIGVTQAPPVGSVELDIEKATTPVSVVRKLVDGTDFTIPRALSNGQPKATLFTVLAPAAGAGSLNLFPGRYKAELKVGGVVVSTQFFEIIAQQQLMGRALFSVPFKIRAAVPVQPEQTLFTPNANFTLARYNPLRLPSDFDYALFQSTGTGRHDLAASFSATAPDGTPLTYEVNDPNTNIAPVGLGYWLDIDKRVDLNTVGPIATNSVAIKLFAEGGGWNMIGAPFIQPSAWGTVSVQYSGTTYRLTDAVANGIVSSALIGYSNGDYVYSIAPNGNLEPFQGYWVRAYKDCTLIIAPSGSSRATAPMVPVKNSNTPDLGSGWRARLIATVSGDRDGQNYFGQAQGATDSSDVYDVPKPPSGAGHAYVRFMTPAANGRSVSNAFDIRSASTRGKIEWTAAVSTDKANSDVTITWDGVGNAPRRTTLTLIDPDTGKRIDMRSRSAYTFKSGEAGSTRMLTIALTPNASSGPLAITNVNVSGGRSAAQSGVAVRFSVTAEAEITGTIKSLTGVKVNDLTGVSRAVGGSVSTLHWDGRSRSGSAVPPGPYLLEITARSADGQTATYKQPIQMLN